MGLNGRIRQAIVRHVRDNIGVYCLITLLLVVGVIFGSLANRALDGTQKADLLNYIQEFFQDLNSPGGAFSSETVARRAIIQNLRNGLLVWLAGLLVFGLPLVLAAVCLRGFALGFTVGFLVNEMGYRGILFSVAALLPQNIFSLPALLVISVVSTAFSLSVIRSRLWRQKTNLRRNLFLSGGLVLCMCGLLIIAGAVEAYITPVFMRLLAGYLT